MKEKSQKISIAPMMGITDKHCRYFLRLISPSVLLYTEMITTGAILNGNKNKLLDFDKAEHPVALQLGGSDPTALAESAIIAESWGYDEINLNVGCPSDRVQSGMFGACLMKQPELVADGVAAMQAAVTIPVTVKTRIGVDELDDYAHLHGFVAKVAEAGCQTFIIHARKAWLQGLSPKQNRDVPPLRYEVVHKLKADFPQLTIIINGGIKTLADVQCQLGLVDGVMLGREVFRNPYILAALESALGKSTPLSRLGVLEQYLPYVKMQLKQGVKLTGLTRPLLGLFHGVRGARQFKQTISTQAHKSDVDEQLLLRAIEGVV